MATTTDADGEPEAAIRLALDWARAHCREAAALLDRNTAEPLRFEGSELVAKARLPGERVAVWLSPARRTLYIYVGDKKVGTWVKWSARVPRDLFGGQAP
jgi:hypothetical protein